VDVAAPLPLQDLARLQSDPRFVVESIQSMDNLHMPLNELQEPLKDVRVRQALNYAVDKEAIVRSIYLGYATPLDSPITPTVWGYAHTGDHYPYDPDKARALLPGAPMVHPECPGNLAGLVVQETGKPDRYFREGALVVRGRWRMARGSAQPMETRGAAALWDKGTRTLTVWSSTQVPHRVRSGLARMLDLPEAQVVVRVPDVGGGFGPKTVFYPEEVLVAWLALRTGRHVHWVEDRRENFIATVHERDQIHEVEAAVTPEGRILALRDRFWHDTGAYCPGGLGVVSITAASMLGPYRIEHARIEGYGVYTNLVPVSAYRGAGRPQATFVLERLMDAVADQLRLDRLEVRRRNLARPGPRAVRTGLVQWQGGAQFYDGPAVEPMLDQALRELDLHAFRREQERALASGRYLGVGIACYAEDTGGGPFEGATVRVEASGNVTVVTGTSAQGQGHETVFAQICADRLGIPPERITIRTGDTGAFYQGIGTMASRIGVVAGSAVADAADAVRARALRLAAALWEVSVDDLVWDQGVVKLAGVPGRQVDLATLARVAGGMPESDAVRQALDGEPGLEATRFCTPVHSTWAAGVHAAVVEVVPDTGFVKVLRYLVVHDCGRLINPMIVDGQVQGALAQGIGGALYERLVFDRTGQLLTATLMDYLLPTASEVPGAEIRHVETPSATNALGARGAGEGGIIPVNAVIAQAVEDALRPLGVQVDAMPLTPDLIRQWFANFSARGDA